MGDAGVIRIDSPTRTEYTLVVTGVDRSGNYSEPDITTMYHPGISQLAQPAVTEHFQALEIFFPAVKDKYDMFTGEAKTPELRKCLGYILRMVRQDATEEREYDLPIAELESSSKVVEIPIESEWEITIGAYDSAYHPDHNDVEFESTFSDPVSAACKYVYDDDIDPEPPEVPTGLSISHAVRTRTPSAPTTFSHILDNDANVRVRWTPKNDEPYFSHYLLEVDNDNTFPDPEIFEQRSNEFLATGLTADERLHFRITAIGENEVGVVVTWNNNPEGNVSEYQLHWKKDEDSEWNSTLTTINQVLIERVEPDTAYNFRLRAINDQGRKSEWTAIVNFTTSDNKYSEATPLTGYVDMPALLYDFVDDTYTAKVNFETLLNHHFYGTEDEFFDGENIYPSTVQTQAIAIGSPLRGFDLVRVTFQPNLNDNRGDISWTSGWLIRVADPDETDRNEWTISSGQQTGLSLASPHYVYARCHKTNDSATMSFSTSRPTFDDGSYWNFVIGMLDTTQDPAVLATSYGFTYIDGNHIATGRIDADTVNIAGGGGSVLIDGSGVLIEDGKLTVKDEADNAIISGGKIQLSALHTGDKRSSLAVPKPPGGKLWHFDRSLISTCGIKPEDGAVATLRPNEGKFGGAVAVEEGTENFYPETDFSHLENNGHDGAEVTVMQNQYFPEWSTHKATRVKTSGGDSTEKIRNTIEDADYLNENKPFFFQIKIKNLSNKEIQWSSNRGGSTYIQPGESVYITRDFSESDSSHFMERFYTETEDDDIDVLLYQPQLEQKPFPTSFVDGSRSKGDLRYDGSVYNPTKGSFFSHIKLAQDLNDMNNANIRFFSTSKDGHSSEIRFWGDSTQDNTIRLYVGTGDSQTYTAIPLPEPWLSDEWRLFGFTWEAVGLDVTYNFYFDDIWIKSWTVSMDSELIYPDTVNIGVWTSGTWGPLNALFDNLLILPYAASEEEIKQWYNSQAPFFDPEGVISSGTNITLDSTGLKAVKNGETTFELDAQTGDAKFAGELQAASGTFTGELEAASGTFEGELVAASGTFEGELAAASGTFEGELVAAEGTFAGELQAATGTFTGELEAASGTFGGSLEAADGTFAGELQAASGTFTELAAVDGSVELKETTHGATLRIENDDGKTIAHLGNTRDVIEDEDNATGVLVLSDQDGYGRASLGAHREYGKSELMLNRGDDTEELVSPLNGPYLRAGFGPYGDRLNLRDDELSIGFVLLCSRLGVTGRNRLRVYGPASDIILDSAGHSVNGEDYPLLEVYKGEFEEIEASTKNFVIHHPEPGKEEYYLRHGAVESPSPGEGLYRYTVKVGDSKEAKVDLPSYFKYLIKDPDVWVNPRGHFGVGHAEIEGNELTLYCNAPGEYKVLIIGTRKDPATEDWPGVEQHYIDHGDLREAYEMNREMDEQRQEEEEERRRLERIKAEED